MQLTFSPLLLLLQTVAAREPTANPIPHLMTAPTSPVLLQQLEGELGGHDTVLEIDNSPDHENPYAALKALMKDKGLTGTEDLAIETVGSPPHRGMVAQHDLEANNLVLTLPFSGMLRGTGEKTLAETDDLINCSLSKTRGIVQNPFFHSDGNGDLTSELYLHRVLSMFVLLEARKGEKSEWYSYMQTLPKEFSTMADFSLSELDELRGTAMFQQTKDKMDTRQSEHKVVELFTSICRPSAAPVTFAEWHWARNVVTTRSFGYNKAGSLSKGHGSAPVEDMDIALIPFVELANHATVNVSWFTENGKFIIYTVEPIKKGEEFFISYGDKLDNQHLMEFYGFVVDSNPNRIPMDCTDGDCECITKHLDAFNTSSVVDSHLLSMSDLSFNRRNAIKLRSEEHRRLSDNGKLHKCSASA